MSGSGGDFGRRRQVAAAELLGPALGGPPHPDRDLPDLLVFQQPPYQLGARVFPSVLLGAAGQQHLRLEPDQSAGHVEVIGRLVEAQLVDGAQKLIGDTGDRDVGDLDLLFAKQVEQEVERAGEGVELDDERRSGAERGGGGFGSVAPLNDPPERPPGTGR